MLRSGFAAVCRVGAGLCCAHNFRGFSRLRLRLKNLEQIGSESGQFAKERTLLNGRRKNLCVCATELNA
jgi:hypothetical protein